MKTIHNIAHIILAAGSSRRMGQPKQLLPFKNTSLVEHAILESLKTNTSDTFVVLGAYYNLIHKQIKTYPVTILKNTYWNQGMGTSISFGIEHLQKEKKYDAVLISLIDQPLLDSTYFNNMILEFTSGNKEIVATKLQNRIGVPAIFPKIYFETLSRLDADHGARYLIEQKQKHVKVLGDTRNGIDIDTMQQYKELIQNRF